MLSAVLIVPAKHVVIADNVGEAMGWGPNNYNVPLSPNGMSPATHYGLHAWVEDDFPAMLQAPVPEPVQEDGISVNAYNAMLAATIASFRVDYMGHFNDIISANGLKAVENQ